MKIHLRNVCGFLPHITPATRRGIAAALFGLWCLLIPPALGQVTDAGQASGTAGEAQPARKELNLFQLFWQSRGWMVPIVGLSFLAAAVSVERFIQLRRSRVIPEGLLRELGRLGSGNTPFDPREAYRICQKYPSATASVIRAMLLKVGRPHSEVEHAVKEASDREAQRLYNNVRWLNLCAAVAPLFGLMGTVWGMIRAFHDTTQLLPGQNKADYLAEGIYLALVTTLAGLAVAIPSAILSHYFESRIVSLFHQIDELLFNLLPQVERFEGRVRFAQAPQSGEDGRAAPPGRSPAAEPPVSA
ncbi:MAG: tolQ-type transporter [Pirellulaceae bacterium]|nr:MAG: tolQ-type transporter [Pirellulaceae bacterium]GIW93814.1 MAG: tolQ-type transporter [Pirellulaceae bacterium]